MRLRSLALLALVAVLLAAPAVGAPPEAPILRIETGMNTAPIWSAEVDAAGRFLVTGSHDKTVRVWDLASGELLRVLRLPIGEGRIEAVAITPDGNLVAVGWLDTGWYGEANIYLFERSTGRLVRGITDLPNVRHLAFSPDSRELVATLIGAYGLRIFRTADGVEVLRGIEPRSNNEWADFDAAGRLVISSWDGKLRLYGSGLSSSLPYGSGLSSSLLDLFTASGEHKLDPKPARAYPRGLLDGFRIDRRGERIRFAFEPEGKRQAAFSLRDRRLVIDPVVSDRFEDELTAPRTAEPGLEITGAWAVNLTADGRLALAAFGDGTIRWFRASDGVELLAFFPHSGGKRWLLWTPSGYYDAPANGEDLTGGHVDRWPSPFAAFSDAVFRDIYRRPDVIDLVLETLDESEALRRADASRGASAADPSPGLVLPPVVTILDPADGSNVSTPTVKLRVNVRSPSGARVDRLLVSIDGRAVTTRDAVWAPSTPNTDARDFYEEREIPIPQRDCTIEVTAEAAGRRGEPARRQLHWVAPAPRHERRAWVLAVGVSKYEHPEYNLGLAAKDATGLAAAWKALEGHGFAKVETRVLTDAAATREAILDGFDWLSAVPAADDDDLMILFLAGHGVNEANQYYFLPYDADPVRRNRTFLSESQLYGVLRALPRRVVLFLDTCRAGSFATGQSDSELKARVDPTGFVNSMASNARVLVFSATASRQLSQESPDWGHGAFTKALIDALTAANREQRKLTTTDLERYLYDTVSAMTGQAQTPTVAKAGLPDIVLVPGSR
jgi:WD40 repeat protein